MRIAILGAGLCGLSVAWYLSKLKKHEITIFSPGGIGKGASGVAAGLLHCYAGAHSKLNWRAYEAIEATKELLAVAEDTLGVPVADHCGIFRPVVREKQLEDFQRCAALHPDVKWVNPDLVGCSKLPGIFIESGIVVDCPLYMNGLWKACANNGAKLEPRAITNLKELDDRDLIICTLGSATHVLPELAHIKMNLVKGQILEFSHDPNDSPMFPYPINSEAYLIPRPKTMTYIAGSTFEKDFSSNEPDIEMATSTIIPKIAAFYPSISTKSLIDCRAGVRVEIPNRRPLLTQVSNRCWVLTGMGSKGLLYHALYGKELVNMAVS